MNGKEITFAIDKYQQTKLLNDKDSLIQIILNALLMVPGNLPSQPKKGVNLFQYSYSTGDSDAISDSILTDLKFTVGDEIGSAINNLTMDVLNTEQGAMFLLILYLSVEKEENESVALVVQKINEKVRFNYSFLTEAIKNME